MINFANINICFYYRQPHTFVIHRGQVGKYLKALETDLRNVMEPNTAKDLKVTKLTFGIYFLLKVRKNNNVKDFVVNGAVLGVTNMMVVTAGESSAQLRMMRFSQGPTLTFRSLPFLHISNSLNL